MADPERHLRELVRRKKARERALALVVAEHDEAVREAHRAGVKRARLVQITGLSPQRIDQIRRGSRL